MLACQQTRVGLRKLVESSFSFSYQKRATGEGKRGRGASEGEVEVRRGREGLNVADVLEKGLAGAYRGRPERGLHELTMRALAALHPLIRRIMLFIGCALAPLRPIIMPILSFISFL